ncbi:hypothetical protein KC318_g9054 [Hortaea werneckii]|nr:hypothetical protein KC324_g7261 [Hortaea werneckii]KAI7583482.1 hypothetical protein KC316_g7251 [Hortaea werneckii]KAI7662111.1 hypothetical protein KC318_g9054 [Hortaea werneckii]
MERSEKAVPQLSTSQGDRTVSTPKVESSKTIINHVLERLPVDALSALAAGIVVAPIVYVIDTAVIEAALGRRTVGRAVRSAATDLALQPHRIVRSKPFLAMLALYSGTYMTVNIVDTMTAKLQADAFTSTWTKLGTVSTRGFGYQSNASAQLCAVCNSRWYYNLRLVQSAASVGIPVA